MKKIHDQDILLTVVIPVLNGERYIEECLLSVIHQEVSNIEILIVDAGSSDQTLQIAEKYRNQDDRIAIINVPVKSYGAQVNIGIQEAKGKYLAILEADDMIPYSAYSKLLKTIVESDADIVKGNYSNLITASNGKSVLSDTDRFKKDPSLYGKVLNARKYTDILRRDLYLWCAVYKLEFIKSNNITLNETPGAAFQDNGFVMQTLVLAASIIYIRDIVYIYRKDNELSSSYNPNGFKYVADEYEFIYKFLSGVNPEELKLYRPLYYLKLMDMIRTRCLLRGLDDVCRKIDSSVIERCQLLLSRGKEDGIIGEDLRSQKDLYEIDLFTRDAETYMQYSREKILVEKTAVNTFLNKIAEHKKIVVWGYGKTGSTFKMLLEKKLPGYNAIWTDSDSSKFEASLDIRNADEVASQDDGSYLYIICCEEYRYEIRDRLHEVFNIPYERIVFYTLGTSHLLLRM